MIVKDAVTALQNTLAVNASIHFYSDRLINSNVTARFYLGIS